MNEPRFPQVHLTLDSSDVDDASQILFELGAEGIEERDDATLARADAQGRVTLVASFPDRDAAHEAISALDARWSPRFEELVGDGWRDAYKEHFHPFALTEHVTIRPPWEEHAATRPDEIVLELEPGRAFGTGLHATTSGVARALDARRNRLAGTNVLDVGTGSGILLLVAVAFGAAKARGIDIDPDAVSAASENVARNGLLARASADHTPIEQVEGHYDIVLANIEARVLIPMAPDLCARVAPGGLLVLSGILDGQQDGVLAAYSGLACEEVAHEGEWVVLVLQRQPRET